MSCPCPARFRAPWGGRIPDTRGAFFLLPAGRESQVFVLLRPCRLSSHHSVPPEPESGSRCWPTQDTPPLELCPSQKPGQPCPLLSLPGRWRQPGARGLEAEVRAPRMAWLGQPGAGGAVLSARCLHLFRGRWANDHSGLPRTPYEHRRCGHSRASVAAGVKVSERQLLV